MSFTFWTTRIVFAGIKGRKRTTAFSFAVWVLPGPSRTPHTVSLIVWGLPFHGVGATLGEAETDVVVAMEETLDELEEAIRSGTELSSEQERALNFARFVFDTEGCNDRIEEDFIR